LPDSGRPGIGSHFLFFLLFGLPLDIFGNIFFQQLPPIEIVLGGKFRSADPSRREVQFLFGGYDLRNVTRDADDPRRYTAVDDHRPDFGAEFNLIRRIDQKAHPVCVDIENSISFPVDG